MKSGEKAIIIENALMSKLIFTKISVILIEKISLKNSA